MRIEGQLVRTWRKLEITGFNPLNAKLNPICYLLALLGAHHILHVSRIRVNGIGCIRLAKDRIQLRVVSNNTL